MSTPSAETGAVLNEVEAVALMHLWDDPGTLWQDIEQHVTCLIAAHLGQLQASINDLHDRGDAEGWAESHILKATRILLNRAAGEADDA